MRKEVEEFAAGLFAPDELAEIYEIVLAYKGSDEEFRSAIGRLRYIIPTRPKRPLYYINHEVGFLPEHSRFVVEQSGSYLDLLLKEFRYELERKYYGEPLGKNVNAILRLKGKNDDSLALLLKQLLAFNNIAYVPSKHVYGLPDDEGHYFEVDDSIVIVLAGVKLGEEIKARSQFARNLAQDLVLPSQKPYSGNWPRTDRDGIPFEFKTRLLESRTLNLDV
jgi:hypothetical protein